MLIKNILPESVKIRIKLLFISAEQQNGLMLSVMIRGMFSFSFAVFIRIWAIWQLLFRKSDFLRRSFLTPILCRYQVLKLIAL